MTVCLQTMPDTYRSCFERMVDELENSEFVCEMKNLELAEAIATKDWTAEWGDAMYDRAWKAEAGLEDCERELQVCKAELYSQRQWNLKLQAQVQLAHEARLLADDKEETARIDRIEKVKAQVKTQQALEQLAPLKAELINLKLEVAKLKWMRTPSPDPLAYLVEPSDSDDSEHDDGARVHPIAHVNPTFLLENVPGLTERLCRGESVLASVPEHPPPPSRMNSSSSS